MCFILDLVMLIAGITTLVRGQLELPGNQVVRGTAAYVVGGMFAAALPFFVACVVVVEAIEALTGQELTLLSLAGMAISFCLLIGGIVVAHIHADAPQPEPTKNPHLDPTNPFSPYYNRPNDPSRTEM